jgi:hypothetical protein
MNHYHLAQVNIAKMLAPFDTPIMQDFIGNIDKINTIADNSNGFIWRLKDEDKELGAKIFQDNSLLINTSVWENLESLFNYTYNTDHIEVFKRRKEWFSKFKMLHMAFWYVPIGCEPNFQDAKNRLNYLNTYGDTPYEFTFKAKFTVKDYLNYKPIF